MIKMTSWVCGEVYDDDDDDDDGDDIQARNIN